MDCQLMSSTLKCIDSARAQAFGQHQQLYRRMQVHHLTLGFKEAFESCQR